MRYNGRDAFVGFKTFVLEEEAVNTFLPPLRQPVIGFGPYLKKVLSDRKISASELARMMAYKSRNSIFRILDEEGGHTARQAFYDRLIEEDPLKLSDDERAEMRQALEVSRVGMQTFMSNRAMREMMMNAEDETDIEGIEIVSENGRENAFIEESVRSCREIHLVVMGCCSREVFASISALLSEKKNGKVSVTHFIYTGSEEIIRNVSAIQPMLYKKYYKAYCVEPGTFSPEREWLYRTNFAFVRVQDESGSWYNRQLLMVDEKRFIMFSRQKSGSENLLKLIFGEDIEKMPMLKKGYFVQDADYPAYTRSCLALEQGRAIYTIKLDVPISYVNADILLECLKDDVDAGRMQNWPGMPETIGELERIHRARWDNLFGKHRMTHTIFSKEAMERFAKTGCQTDHFFALRPYKPLERVRILSHIREQAEINPYFNVYFFKDGFLPPQMEIGLYEGVGTLLNKPFTHYDLSGDHTETLITQKEFCECYKEYFVKDLLDKRVIGQEETLRTLDELIEIARTCE